MFLWLYIQVILFIIAILQITELHTQRFGGSSNIILPIVHDVCKIVFNFQNFE